MGEQISVAAEDRNPSGDSWIGDLQDLFGQLICPEILI
jgi:hypothetical protein